MVGVRDIAGLLKPLRRLVALTVGRAVLNLVDDARKLQAVQVTALEREVLDDVERFQQYGFTAHPHPGAECVVLAVGGIRQHSIVIAVDDRRYRVVGLEQGEVCLYTDEDAADRIRTGSRSSEAARSSLRPAGRSPWSPSKTLDHAGGAPDLGDVMPGVARVGADAASERSSRWSPSEHRRDTSLCSSGTVARCTCPVPATHNGTTRGARGCGPHDTYLPRRRRGPVQGVRADRAGWMTDLALGWNNRVGFGDLRVVDADLLGDDDGLTTAVLVSLFTDARASLADLPAGDTERRGWWGEQLDDDDDRFGSLLWLLERAKLTAETLALAERYTRDALQWILDDGMAVSIDAATARDGLDRMSLRLRIERPDRSVREFQFDDVLRGL